MLTTSLSEVDTSAEHPTLQSVTVVDSVEQDSEDDEVLLWEILLVD